MSNAKFKKSLIVKFTQHLEAEYAALKQAALTTHDAAIGDESRPENQYDTRALEASYLAGAQDKRVAEIGEVLAQFQNMKFKDFGAKDPIAITALVRIEVDGKQNMILILPKGGGESVDHESTHVQIVTPNSSLREAIVGLQVGELAEYEIGNSVRECKVLSIA